MEKYWKISWFCYFAALLDSVCGSGEEDGLLLKWYFSPLGVIGSTVSGIVNVCTHLKLLLTKGVGSYKIISLFTRCDKDILQR